MSRDKLCRLTSVEASWTDETRGNRASLPRRGWKGSSSDPRPATGRAYKQPLPPSRLDPGKKTVSGIIIKNRGLAEAKKDHLSQGPEFKPPLQESVQWDGRGQDTINSRCTGGCTASPCINIDSLCIPALYTFRGINAKRCECTRGCFFCVWKLKVDVKGLLKELQGLLCGRNNNLSYQGQGLTEGQRCLFILLARSRNESDSVFFRGASRAVEGVYSPPGVPLEAPGSGQPRAFACAWGLSCRCRRQLPRYKLTQGSHQISILSKWGTDHGRLS